jgi:hypothetical protein
MKKGKDGGSAHGAKRHTHVLEDYNLRHLAVECKGTVSLIMLRTHRKDLCSLGPYQVHKPQARTTVQSNREL